MLLNIELRKQFRCCYWGLLKIKLTFTSTETDSLSLMSVFYRFPPDRASDSTSNSVSDSVSDSNIRGSDYLAVHVSAMSRNEEGVTDVSVPVEFTLHHQPRRSKEVHCAFLLKDQYDLGK